MCRSDKDEAAGCMDPCCSAQLNVADSSSCDAMAVTSCSAAFSAGVSAKQFARWYESIRSS